MSYTFLSPVVGRTPDVPSPIRMYPVGNEVYVAFCDDDIKPHYLEVAGTLYVFMQDGMDYDGVVDAIASVLQRLPIDSDLYGHSLEDIIESKWISQAVATESDEHPFHLAQSPNVRRHIKE